jgi:amidase
MEPEARFEVEGALKLSALDVYQASVSRSDWYQCLRWFFERYDYLLVPAAQMSPSTRSFTGRREVAGKTMDTYHRWMEVVLPWTLAGCPVISVPVGFNDGGLPMGMQIVSQAHADLAVLQIGYAYKQATGWMQKRLPPML